MRFAICILAIALQIGFPAGRLQAQAVGSVGNPAVRTFPVDDSGTVVLAPFLNMKWRPQKGQADPGLATASTRVSLQLNLSAWIGRSGRIYMVLPRNQGPPVRATWTTGGKLLPGVLISGERAVVYSGPITEPLLRDVIELTLDVDQSRLEDSETLAFGFEIELDR